MGIFEFDQEVYDEVLREDGEAIGMEKGKKIGREEGVMLGMRIFKKIHSGETDNKAIAESCGCTIEEVEMARKQYVVI